MNTCHNEGLCQIRIIFTCSVTSYNFISSFCRKYKLILGEEPVEKRRKIQTEMPLSPIDYSMSGFYRRVEAATAYPEGENSPDKCSSERSTPPQIGRAHV